MDSTGQRYTRKHDPVPMIFVASHFHGRSTRSGTSWTDKWRCSVCDAVINRPANLFKGKPDPICKGGRPTEAEQEARRMR